MNGTRAKFSITGSLGDVMKESATTAITCIRTRAETLGISPDFYAKKDIHIHAPGGRCTEGRSVCRYRHGNRRHVRAVRRAHRARHRHDR